MPVDHHYSRCLIECIPLAAVAAVRSRGGEVMRACCTVGVGKVQINLLSFFYDMLNMEGKSEAVYLHPESI